MTTTFDRIATYLDRFLPIKSHGFLLARSSGKLKLLAAVAIVTKRGWMMAYLEVLLTIKSFNTLITWSWVTNKNHYISTTRVLMVTKLGRMIT